MSRPLAGHVLSEVRGRPYLITILTPVPSCPHVAPAPGRREPHCRLAQAPSAVTGMLSACAVLPGAAPVALGHFPGGWCDPGADLHFTSMNVNVNSSMWPMATVLYSAVPTGPRVLSFWFYFVIFFSQSQHPFFATVVVYVAISLSLNFWDLSLHDIQRHNQVYGILF